jgi:hypothetical protein
MSSGTAGPGAPGPPSMIFNVGSRRSGTYWLQRIVCAHPEVAEVPSETHLFSHGLAPLLERFQYEEPSAPDVGLVYANRDEVIGHLRALCETIFESFRDGRASVAERTPLHVNHIPLIHEVYPDARFIHIIRDGRDVARSITRQEWGPNTIEGAASEWRDSVSNGRAASGSTLTPAQYREVRYEALLADPEPEIAGIHSFLSLDSAEGGGRARAAGPRHANIGPSKRGGVGVGKWQDEWSAEQIAEFDSVAGELLRELGYM